MHDDVDETILRIGSALRPLPDVDPSKVARVLVAVAAERERDRELEHRRRTVRRWSAAGGALAAAALVVAVALGGSQADDPRRAAAVAAAPTVTATAAPAAQLAAEPADGVVSQPVQFVFRAPAADRVSIVGDFNGWSTSAAVMTRDPASGLWSGTVLLRPGRHVYAFVVDDSIWARDPRQPAATDPDFGRPGSVLLVGRP